MGNDNFELRIDLEDFEGRTENVTYTTFNVGDASTKYKLTIGGYSGTLGINIDSPSATIGLRHFSTRAQALARALNLNN